MSWFDAAGLASIAKSALKGAQRTIDKALDIQDEEISTVPVNTPIDTNPDDFFGTWGIAATATPSTPKESSREKSEDVAHKAIVKSHSMSTSLWGSFTGSFFETPNKDSPVKSRDSVESLDDSIDVNEHFRSSKLVVQASDETDHNISSISEEGSIPITEEPQDLCDLKNDETSNINLTVVKRRPEKRSNNDINRLSVISSSSGRNSSESVEVLSGTGCTTTPDSEAFSITQSISTSSLALGLKQNSDSVEVLFESVTSPSSVEVINSDDTSSRRQSQYTDEFVSPLQSPVENLSVPTSLSPDSVEVIPEDQDDNSAAEDTISYTSVSESTATTMVESNLSSIYKKASIIGEKITEEPIVRAPQKSGLPLPPMKLNKPLIDTQPQSSKQDISTYLKNYNIIDIPQDNDSLKSASPDTTLIESNDEGSQSDKTVIPNDSFMESSSDTSTTTDSNTNSLYLKTMIADAMTEKSSDHSESSQKLNEMYASSKSSELFESISASQIEMVPRETSPLSSESRSDLVKIGSDHTSGHTSGDELETTTSSDIEIISSPNGDSSSTHSRHSPAKLNATKIKTGDANVDMLLEKMTFKKIKGHNRELSGASTASDDSEVERLIKRVNEMTEILESREAKLIEVSRKNVELQEMNSDLKNQLDTVLNKQIDSSDLTQVTEEYTQRLSALEKKFQQAIREKDTLRKQLEQAKQEAAVRISKGEIESLISEKDETINQLREEGEKLSKQQLQHSNIIKKLRAKEKENESTIKHLKEKVEEFSSETERLKKTLTAKEEVERSQIDAVYQLTAKNKKLEKDSSQLQSEFDDLNMKHDVVKKSLDAAKKELADKNRANSELQAKEQVLQSLENEKQMTKAQIEDVMSQLIDLRHRLQEADSEYLRKEDVLRTENKKLMKRVESAEQRNEELSQSICEVSKPLLAQIEQLQAAYNKKNTTFEKVEHQLNLKIAELQSRLQHTSESEKLNKEECISMKTSISNMESSLSAALHERELLKMELEQIKTKHLMERQEMERKLDEAEHQVRLVNEKLEALDKENEILQQKLAAEIEKKKMTYSQEMVQTKNEPLPMSSQGRQSPHGDNPSPTPSIGRASIADSFASSFWPSDDTFEPAPTSRCTNMLEIQLLQTSLRQREGEVQQFQWELNRREHERTLLNTEISDLLTRIEKLEEKLKDHDALSIQFSELQQQYDTLCQLYGEKVEENEELKLDLLDVKEAYKSQIDELLKNQKSSQSSETM